MDDDYATVEIKVSKSGGRGVTLHQCYRVAPDLARTLAGDLDEVIASLAAGQRRRVVKTQRRLKRRGGKTVTRIELTILPRRPAAAPSFRDQFKHPAQTGAPDDDSPAWENLPAPGGDGMLRGRRPPTFRRYPQKKQGGARRPPLE